MDKIELSANKRDLRGRQNSQLRKAGQIPAVLYGHGTKSEALTIDSHRIERVYREAGKNKIITLRVGEGRSRNVLIYEIQRDAVRGELRHVDFYALKMDEAIKTEIPLRYVGESTAVYQDEGTLVKNMESVEVECLPADLPDGIDIDISGLDDFEKSITLGDLVLPVNVKLVSDELGQLVAKVEPPRSESELADLEEAVIEDVPESVKEDDPVVVSEENEGSRDRGGRNDK